MLTTITVLACTFLAPQSPKEWVVSQSDAAQPSAVVVAGQVELTRREAKASALERLREDTRDRQLEHGRSVIRAAAPVWLPNFVAEQALREWVRGLGDPLQRSVRILDDDVKVRDHGFGQSFQAFLLVEEDASQADRSGRELERRLDRRVRRFVVLSGGVVGFWAVLAFVVAWIDRLSRGYMTWRLRGIALGLGAAVPAILFLL